MSVMSTVDNLMAFKFLYLLVQPFNKTKAFKLGVIDAEGKLLIKSKDQTTEQKEAYDYLDRLVFNLKRLLGKLPGGKSMLASLIAALYLIREEKMTNAQIEERFNQVLSKILENDIILVEETLLVEEFLEMYTEDGAVAGIPGNGQVVVPASNSPPKVTGQRVSTDIPVIRKKKRIPRKFAQFEVAPDTFDRFKKGKKKFTKWSEYLNLADPEHSKIYDYAKKNPKGVLVLKNGDRVKGIRYNKNGGGKWHKIARRGKPVDMIQVEEL